MNKKKLVISLLVFIMVLSLALTALVGCNNDDNKGVPKGYKKMSTSLASALSDPLYNTARENNVNSLTANAKLKVSASYGGSTSEYLVTFGGNIALSDDADPTSFGLSIVDAKANNANILNIWYYETPAANASKDNYQIGKGNIYVDLGNGDNQQSFAINGLSIKSVLKSEGKLVDDDQADKINTDVIDAIDGVLSDLGIVFDIGEVYQKQDNSEIIFKLSLAKVFEDAGDLLESLDVIDQYTDTLGLALKSSDLKTLLPALTLDLHVKMEGAKADFFEDAIITGVNAEIGVSKKDLKVTRTDGTSFIHINIDKDVKFGLDFDFEFGGDADVPAPLDPTFASYTTINAINFTAGGELDLNADIDVNIKLNDSTTISLSIPKGKYDIKVAADINPVALLGMSFNTDGSLDSIINLVIGILTKAVEVLDLEITPQNPAQEGRLVLKIASDTITFDASLLGSDPTITSIASLLNNKSVSTLSSLVKQILPMLGISSTPSTGSGDGTGSGNAGSGNSGNIGSGNIGSGNGSGETPSGDDGDDGINVEELMATLAPIIKNLTIGVNDGSDILKVIFENYSVAKNIWKATKTETKFDEDEGKDVEVEVAVIDEATGKQKEVNLGDTTIDASVLANKNGITLKAVIKNIILNSSKAGKATEGSNDGRLNVAAQIEVNKNGITITAKSATSITGEAQTVDFGSGIAFPIDLVLKLNSFKLGNASDVA